MATNKASFTRNLKIVFAVMLLTAMAIAWYFYDSARWFARDVERITSAAQVLDAYQETTAAVARQLHAMTDAVDLGTAPADRTGNTMADNNQAIANALSAAQLALQSERTPAASAADEPGLLAEAALAASAIESAALSIEAALRADDPAVARDALNALRDQGEASRFFVIMDGLVNERHARLVEAGEQALSLSDYVMRLLPAVAGVLLLFAGITLGRFSRSIKLSIGALHEAVAQFSSGNLRHRIPSIREREFHDLGSAFNTMASQLSDQGDALRNTNARLESMVEERTRELQESNDKLARVDEHRRRLLADISHEFRTPLTVIKGESEIAMRGKGLGPEDYRESLRRIVDTTDHATALVEDLLFIVRANAGEPRLQVEPVEVTEMVSRACEEFTARARQNGVHIRQAASAGQAVLNGDARRLRQVFAILLDNALRYSNEGGTIEVTVKTGKKEVRIMVRDEGIGLTEEEAAMAFERFYRGGTAVSHAQQGSGLGLPVAKAIIEAHQGRITLEGEPGKGAVATVRLPMDGGHLRVVA